MIHVPSSSGTSKRALIGYLPESYSLATDHPKFFGHSNFQECRALIDILVETGYSCDVLDWQADLRHLSGSDYDLFLSPHTQLAYARSLVNKRGRVVFYSTFSYWRYHNSAETARLVQLRGRRDILLLPRRQLQPVAFEDQIDELWHLGNDFQKDTYHHVDVPKYRINISTVEPSVSRHDIGLIECSNHFLWFGSVGAVHKGLDWLLEIFARNSELHLHICGLVAAEPDFVAAYQRELLASPNIHWHGWVLPNTPEFADICKQCAFVVTPSVSEGGGGATLQCMRAGLIPIVTRGASVDIGDSGWLVQVDELEEVELTIRRASMMAARVVCEQAVDVYDHIQRAHTLEAYRDSVRRRIAALEEF
jgi:glycosyltransferase involved in cell wall biosynthesis